jgi:hypothetical protein
MAVSGFRREVQRQQVLGLTRERQDFPFHVVSKDRMAQLDKSQLGMLLGEHIKLNTTDRAMAR